MTRYITGAPSTVLAPRSPIQGKSNGSFRTRLEGEFQTLSSWLRSLDNKLLCFTCLALSHPHPRKTAKMVNSLFTENTPTLQMIPPPLSLLPVDLIYSPKLGVHDRQTVMTLFSCHHPQAGVCVQLLAGSRISIRECLPNA